jgi:hypothetical protein
VASTTGVTLAAAVRPDVNIDITRDSFVGPGGGESDRGVGRRRGNPHRIPFEQVAHYQRIVVNPFLGVLAWVIMVAVIGAGVRRHSVTVFLSGLSLLLVGFALQQFHCLDCGATGWLYRYKRHACPSVVARYENVEFRPIRLPNVPTQVTIWTYVLAGALLLLLMFLGGPGR